MHSDVIRPGATLGLLGGGQLGRMLTLAARNLGYRVHALDPGHDCPAGQVADLEVRAHYNDVYAAQALARGVDVMTVEFENIPSETLEAVAELRPMRPSAFVLHTVQHRLREKRFLLGNGLQTHLQAAEAQAADDIARHNLRQQVKHLTLPSEMGERFQAIGFQRGVELDAAFLLGDLSHRL